MKLHIMEVCKITFVRQCNFAFICDQTYGNLNLIGVHNEKVEIFQSRFTYCYMQYFKFKTNNALKRSFVKSFRDIFLPIYFYAMSLIM